MLGIDGRFSVRLHLLLIIKVLTIGLKLSRVESRLFVPKVNLCSLFEGVKVHLLLRTPTPKSYLTQFYGYSLAEFSSFLTFQRLLPMGDMVWEIIWTEESMMDFLISTKYTFTCSLLQPKPLQSGLKLIPSRPSKTDILKYNPINFSVLYLGYLPKGTFKISCRTFVKTYFSRLTASARAALNVYLEHRGLR